VLLVRNSADEAAYVPALEAAGYVLHIREPEWHDHHLLKDANVNVAPSFRRVRKKWFAAGIS
jgi:hypothetical protein